MSYGTWDVEHTWTVCGAIECGLSNFLGILFIENCSQVCMEVRIRRRFLLLLKYKFILLFIRYRSTLYSSDLLFHRSDSFDVYFSLPKCTLIPVDSSLKSNIENGDPWYMVTPGIGLTRLLEHNYVAMYSKF